MSESETYKELGALTRCKERWERWGWHILMPSKATCLLLPPSSIMKSLFRFAHDEAPGVRLAFIWASENIATNTPNPYQEHMLVFVKLLRDCDDKVSDTNRVVRIHCQGAIRAAGVKHQ